MKRISLILFLLACGSVTAQDTIRVCTYNVLNYSIANESGRKEKYQRIFQEIQPDIILLQDIVDSASAYNLWLAALQVEGYFEQSVFHNGPDSDNHLFYRIDKLELLDTVYLPTPGRDIGYYTLRHRKSGEIMHLYNVHLKAGDYSKRNDEIKLLKAKLPVSENAKIVVAGSFNGNSSGETNYTLLVNSASQQMIDPMGPWTYSSVLHSNYYSHSTRAKKDPNCGGGEQGGLANRFDLILYSQALSNNYIPGSHTIFGNDGQNRMGKDIDNPSNTKFSELASDLRCASDHLPVYADFIFEGETAIDFPGMGDAIQFKETSGYIQVFLSSGGIATVTDLLGRIVLKIEGNNETIYINQKDFLPGIYVMLLQNKELRQYHKFIVTE